MKTEWYEVWTDDPSEPPYVLLLCATAAAFRILDPREGNRIVFEDASLDNVRNFLMEDEYTMVDGRMFPDE